MTEKQSLDYIIENDGDCLMKCKKDCIFYSNDSSCKISKKFLGRVLGLEEDFKVIEWNLSTYNEIKKMYSEYRLKILKIKKIETIRQL